MFTLQQESFLYPKNSSFNLELKYYKLYFGLVSLYKTIIIIRGVKLNWHSLFKLLSMKSVNTLPQNIIICVFYSLVSLLAFYIYKRSIRPSNIQSQQTNKNPQHYQTKIKNTAFLVIMIKTALKKFTFASFLNQDKKYFLSELFIISSFGACCLHINHIIIWPCFLGILLIVSTNIIRCIGVYLFDLQKIGDISDIQQVMNSNHIQNAIQILEANIMTSTYLKRNRSKELDRTYLKDKCAFQIIFLFGQAFGALILMSYTIFTLSNSISNSGYLNLVSVLLVFCLDSLIRLVVGSLIVSSLYVLNQTNAIELQQSNLINFICKQQIAVQRKAILYQIKKIQLQLTVVKHLLREENDQTNYQIQQQIVKTQIQILNAQKPLSQIQQKQDHNDLKLSEQSKIKQYFLQQQQQSSQNHQQVQCSQSFNNYLDRFELTSPQIQIFGQNTSKLFSSRVKTQKATRQTDRAEMDFIKPDIIDQTNCVKNKIMLTNHLDLQNIDSQCYIQNAKLSPQKKQQAALANKRPNSNIATRTNTSQLKVIRGKSPYFVDLAKQVKSRSSKKQKITNKNKSNKQNFQTQNLFYRQTQNQQN